MVEQARKKMDIVGIGISTANQPSVPGTLQSATWVPAIIMTILFVEGPVSY